MSILLVAVLAAAQPLPFIDRAALRTLARFEASRDAKPARPRASRTPRRMTELCGIAGDAAAPTADLGRVYSMSAPRVSILRSACALDASRIKARPAKLGSRGATASGS